MTYKHRLFRHCPVKASAMALIVCSVIYLQISPSNATPGDCYKKAENGIGQENICQFQVTSLSQAPGGAISKGLRLDKGVTNVLFNNYPNIGPHFIDNISSHDHFLPQATEAEFKALLDSGTPNFTVSFAIPPTTYKAMPRQSPTCPSLLTGATLTSPASINALNVPSVSAAATPPVIVNSYTRLNGTTANPLDTVTTIGTTNIDGPIQFTYTRKDCAADKVTCNIVNFKEDQLITFSSSLYLGNYIWNTTSPTIKNQFYYNINGGPYQTVDVCRSHFTPGVCGTSNGKGFPAAPTTNLCTSGTASPVTKVGTNWTWTCTDVTPTACSATSAINGACGGSNGQTLKSAPSSSLCSVGNASGVSVSGNQWVWTCKGVNGGKNANCSANAAQVLWCMGWYDLTHNRWEFNNAKYKTSVLSTPLCGHGWWCNCNGTSYCGDYEKGKQTTMCQFGWTATIECRGSLSSNGSSCP